jgi:hypothetical protein
VVASINSDVHLYIHQLPLINNGRSSSSIVDGYMYTNDENERRRIKGEKEKPISSGWLGMGGSSRALQTRARAAFLNLLCMIPAASV